MLINNKALEKIQNDELNSNNIPEYYKYVINKRWKYEISSKYWTKRLTNDDIFSKTEEYMKKAQVVFSEAERIKAEQERSEQLYGYN
ncbi:hypothetical protein [Mycoplasma buteonis]|uniref:hypothetical protein n=1 Tax=Mycoplasma buteonis TaxID=171280 RepID=UPI000569E317|nr:hypothetical protein [Mycoplasma buteonis]